MSHIRRLIKTALMYMIATAVLINKQLVVFNRSDVMSQAAGTSSRWKRRWTIIGLCFIAFMLCNMDRVNMSIAILPMAKQYGWDTATIGIVQSSFFWYCFAAASTTKLSFQSPVHCHAVINMSSSLMKSLQRSCCESMNQFNHCAGDCCLPQDQVWSQLSLN